MTKGGRKSRGVQSSETKLLPWRPFSDRPTGIWINETVALIKQTGQPELIKSLQRNPIPKDAKFWVLRHLITVDGTKRPDGDNCPCPVCTPNRFLTGSLVWYYELQFCAFIGNCCANDDVLAEAERERKWREKRDHEEDYLLAALPLVASKVTVLDSLKPVALEAVRAYRKIRNTLPQVHEQLRKMKQHHGGQMTLTEVIRDESQDNDDYFGPAGFKGRGKDGVETRDHTFGTFAGHIAVIRDYNPQKELETIHRSLMSVAANAYDQTALDFICGMDEKQRHAAVVILQDVEDSIVKFKARLQDLASFYSRENAEKFNRFFTHDLNSVYYRVEYTTTRGQPTLSFKKGASHYDLVRGSWAEKLEFDWPTK
ncbi:hypothetical protein [Bradyrhizobium sp. JYMT SZCCT0428]|uniref:hypothetical protein n=1 Tax=Bradyrhizobium sp. JYMT SZCCT0428 TaxID=2807673 RepID=UPI001BAAE365|nr:hypothetical protein [Bradyrhizobium sp. JYMT SZCCT0428]MBR1155185.1 hypothetical protein [Bradyrhizobium sp. JYMT SZCCT0428]